MVFVMREADLVVKHDLLRLENDVREILNRKNISRK